MEETIGLASLQKKREKRGIVVRVVRKWIVKADQGHGEPLYAAVVLSDAKKDSIYAEISAQLLSTKEHLLQIGKVYVISKFKVTNAKTSFRAVDKPLMIQFSESTTVQAAKNYPTTIPEYIYKLTPFQAIVPAGNTVFNYTDVIGYVSKYTLLESFVPKNKEKVTHMRKVYIKDLNEKEMNVTLWGDNAINFGVDNIYDEEAGNVVVCLLVGCIPRSDYKEHDKNYLSGGGACFYYLNPAIPEANPFYIKFKDVHVHIDRPAQPENTMASTIGEVPLKMMTMADLNAIADPFDFEDGKYKCEITITSILDKPNWWYMSCRRHKNKALRQMDHTYKCPICKQSDTVPRYMLSFVGADQTAEAKFFAYDTEAMLIVGKDCEAIMNPLHGSDGLPERLKKIINQKYTFSIDLSDDEERKYVIKAVLQRPSNRPPHFISAASISQSQAQLAQLVPSGQPGSSTQVSLSQVQNQSDQRIQAEQTVASNDMLQIAQKKQDVLSIELEAQTTTPPPPSVDLTSQKDGATGSLPLSVSARRKLFQDTASIDRTIPDTQEAAAVQTESESTTSCNEDPLQPPAKKTRTKCTKQGSKQNSNKSTPSDA